MQLYEFGPTRSIRARWVLQELDVDFAAHQVNLVKGEHRSPEFLRLNPLGRVPVLVDGELVLTESVAICVYLAEKYASKGFMPMERDEHAQTNRWLLFTATELEQPLWRMAKNKFLYPEAQRLAADIPLASSDFKAVASVLQQHMRNREFVVGNRVTVADFVLAYTLDWANEYGLLEEFPELRGYMERMYARPKAAPRIAVASAQTRASA